MEQTILTGKHVFTLITTTTVSSERIKYLHEIVFRELRSVKGWLKEISADKFQSPVDENSLVLTKSHSPSDY